MEDQKLGLGRRATRIVKKGEDLKQKLKELALSKL